ncbi:MAG TPA: hypothetical protein PLM07_16660 [Candidatus Rifleibacterium sp.]|nr:hypothetical protein [Candidatus Rifleibacterium sp.]HPT47516.1 hypothetical protein [Candidatus Rifleibacterium sp.]
MLSRTTPGHGRANRTANAIITRPGSPNHTHEANASLVAAIPGCLNEPANFMTI